MSRVISHKGTVISSDPDFTVVEIIRGDACSECHARELCGVAKEEHKTVTVRTDPFNIHDAGDQVELCMKPSMGVKAVWISYVIPLLLMMAALLVLFAIKVGELYCGLGAIAVVAIYYMVLFFLRGRLENEFEFFIRN